MREVSRKILILSISALGVLGIVSAEKNAVKAVVNQPKSEIIASGQTCEARKISNSRPGLFIGCGIFE